MEKLQNGQMIEWEDLDKRRYYVIGPSLFMFVRGFIYPFNLIKTRLFMQQQSTIYTGTYDAFKKVVKHEGIRGLYRGFIVSAVGLISGQLYITTYELMRSNLQGYSTEIKGLVGGASATLIAQTVTVPVDIVSQIMMMQGQVVKAPKKNKASYILVKNVDYIIPKQKKVKLRGAIPIVKEIFRNEGFRGFYKGYSVSLMTYAPNSALWWMSYTGSYRKSVEWGTTELLPIPIVQALCGVFSGLFAATLTNPLDVIRTRYQLEMTMSISGTVKKLWNEEGVAFLKKGLSARIMSTAPTSAILVLSYEWVKRMSLRTPIGHSSLVSQQVS